MKTEPTASELEEARGSCVLLLIPFDVEQPVKPCSVTRNQCRRVYSPSYTLSVTVCHVSATFFLVGDGSEQLSPPLRPCTYQSCISHTCNGEGDRLETTTSNFWIYVGLHVLSQALKPPGSKLGKTGPDR